MSDQNEEVNLTDFLAMTLNNNNNEYEQLNVQTQELGASERRENVQKAAQKQTRRRLDEYRALTKLQN